MSCRLAEEKDIDAVSTIYEEIHTAEETGPFYVGWQRGVYPTRATAEMALQRGQLYVAESESGIVGAAIINQVQIEEYAAAPWHYPARPEEVAVLHTLVVSPRMERQGCGRAVVAFYEHWARQHGCPYLRMDTNVRNLRARELYRHLGYREVGLVRCPFNGIEAVELVLLEKAVE